MLDTGNFWLSETPDLSGSRSWDTSCVRMVTWAVFLNEVDNRKFCVFNTHFDHVSEEARQKSAVLVWDRIKHLRQNLPVFLVGDFNNPQQIKNVISEYLQKTDQITILVNNSGGPKGGSIIDTAPSEFIKAFNRHLICNQILVQALLNGMKDFNYGRIINIIST